MNCVGPIMESKKQLRCRRRLEYALSRNISHAGDGGWYFEISRQDQLIKRTFEDADYGGKDEALAVARAYKTAVIAAFPPATIFQRAQKIRKSNKSGMPGVYIAKSRGSLSWCAAVMINRKSYSRVFSIRKYGEEKAKELAIAARYELLAEFNPRFVTHNEEATSYAEEHFEQHLNVIPEPKRGKWLDDNAFRKKLEKINAAFPVPQRKKLYINVKLMNDNRIMRIYVSTWQIPSSWYDRGISNVSNPIVGPLKKIRTLLNEKITEFHEKQAALAFMQQYGDLLEPENFDVEDGLQLRLVEKPDAKPFTWMRVRE